MDDDDPASKATAALRLYERRLDYARHEYDIAAKALADAKVALDAADLAFEAAQHVFRAGEADRARELGFDKMAPSTLAWLRALAEHDVFGMPQARDAAISAGLTLSDDAIRQHLTRYNAKGVFIPEKRGVYRVSDRARSELAATHTSSEMHSAPEDGDTSPSPSDDDRLNGRDAVEQGREDEGTVDSARPDSQPPASVIRSAGTNDDLDYLDDDTPF